MAAHEHDETGNQCSDGCLAQQPDELQAATISANCLLISSLEAGDHPVTDDAELDAQIAAYTSCINTLSSVFRQSAAGDPPDAAHPNSSPPGRDQARPPATMQHDQSGTAAVPGLGREGIDYTVRYLARSAVGKQNEATSMFLAAQAPFSAPNFYY